MEDIDALSTQDLTLQAGEQERTISDIPMRRVSVFADSDCTATHMEYKVLVEGIREAKTISIIRHFETEGTHTLP